MRAVAALLLALLQLLALLAPRGAGSHADEAAPHGLEHPPVTIRTHPPTGRLAWSAARAGWLELRVGVSGAIPGFRYRVMLEAIANGEVIEIPSDDDEAPQVAPDAATQARLDAAAEQRRQIEERKRQRVAAAESAKSQSTRSRESSTDSTVKWRWVSTLDKTKRKS